jgi:hypothetical protein
VNARPIVALALAVALASAAGLGAGACGKSNDAPADDRADVAPRDPLVDVALPAGATRLAGNQFTVDVAAQPGCTAGADCAVLADLASLGDFKVNPEYPFKFVPAAGTLAPTATFTITAVHRGRLVLRFRRPSADPVRVAGDFKLSVCNTDRCLIEVAPLAVDLP